MPDFGTMLIRKIDQGAALCIRSHSEGDAACVLGGLLLGGELDPPSREGAMKTVMITAAVVVGIVINVANAAPLPEAKPDDVGFSQQGL
jgi:hypothetical protein